MAIKRTRGDGQSGAVICAAEAQRGRSAGRSLRETVEMITLHNFQSHRDTALALTPGLNVIVGPSDVGKSAIIRALYWAVFNRPTGDSFRSEWGGDTEVILRLSSGSEVRRSRSASFNGYQLSLPTAAHPFRYSAVRTDVPPEIAVALNMNEINFQGQHDPPFAVSLTAGALARALNEVVDLAAIDRALAAGASQVRRNTAEAEGYAEEWKVAGAERDMLAELVAPATAAANMASSRQEVAVVAAQECSILTDILAGRAEQMDWAERTERIAHRMNRLVTAGVAAVDVATCRQKEAAFAAQECGVLTDLLAERADQMDRVRRAELTAHTMSRLVAAGIACRKEAERAGAEAVHMAAEAAALEGALAAHIKATSWVLQTVQKAEEVRETFDAAMKSAGACPLCGRVT